jgi:hypothetical protein
MFYPIEKRNMIKSFEFNKLGDKNEVDEDKVNSYTRESIKIIREKVYPNLNDSELENFNNKLSKFLII